MRKNSRKANRLTLKRLEKMMEHVGAEYIFTLPLVLNAILSDDALSRICQLIKTANYRSLSEGAFQGYKLAIATSLYGFLDAVARNPKLLGIKLDDTFYDYWAFTKLQGRDKLEGGSKRGNDLSGIAAKVQELAQLLLEVRNWDGLKQYRQSLQPICSALTNILDRHFALRGFNSSHRLVASRDYFKEQAPDTIWRDLLNSDLANHVHAELYQTHIKILPEQNTAEDDFESEELTRLDDDWRGGVIRVAAPGEWAFGYAFAITQAMVTLASNELSARIEEVYHDRDPIKSWYRLDKYEIGLKGAFGHLPSLIPISLVKIGRITKAERAPLIAPEKATMDEVEFIRSRMGNRARIVEQGSPAARFSFDCVLTGAVASARRNKEKALILIIEHPAGAGRHDYSFAVLMPARGVISNASLWWVFYDVADDWDNEGSFALQKIGQLLRKRTRGIEILKVTAAKDKFYEFCEDPGYVRLRRQIASLRNLHGKIRGSFPELLLVAYLARRYARPICTRFKPKFLGKELDVIGCLYVNGAVSEIVIFESKGGATTHRELEEELRKFEERIQLVSARWEDTAKELGIPADPIPRLTAIFVSMASINTAPMSSSSILGGLFNTPAINVPSGIQLWDFNMFQDKLRESGIPNDYINLLQEKPLYFEM